MRCTLNLAPYGAFGTSSYGGKLYRMDLSTKRSEHIFGKCKEGMDNCSLIELRKCVPNNLFNASIELFFVY